MSANTATTDPARFAADRAHLPGWVYILFMLLVFALGLGALWVNREHAYANLTLLRLPEEALFVRQRSIDLFAAAHLVLFFLVAILPRERFGSLRLRMAVVAFAVVAFETAGMWQSRFGIALSGQAATAADARRIQDLQADIAEARRNAAGLRESAAGQAKSIYADSRAAGLDALKQASASTDRANTLGAELAALRAGKAPAEADIWGDWMPYKAAAEAILVTLLSMLMFATAGNMGRAARDVYLTRPNGKAKPAGLPTYSVTMPHPGRAAAGLGAAGAAAGAHAMPVYAPPLPTVPAASALADASTQKHASPLDAFTRKHATPGEDASTQKHATPVEDASTRKQTGPDDASTRKHATSSADAAKPQNQNRKTAGQGGASRTTKPRTPTAVPDGAKIDTGVIPGSNSRYLRVVAAVQAKKHTPTLAAIQHEHGGGPTVAMRYQREMLRTGVIVPREKGRGYRVA